MSNIEEEENLASLVPSLDLNAEEPDGKKADVEQAERDVEETSEETEVITSKPSASQKNIRLRRRRREPTAESSYSGPPIPVVQYVLCISWLLLKLVAFPSAYIYLYIFLFILLTWVPSFSPPPRSIRNVVVSCELGVPMDLTALSEAVEKAEYEPKVRCLAIY